jgi:hypothetical protein
MENPNFFQNFNQTLQLITPAVDKVGVDIDANTIESSSFVGDFSMKSGSLQSGKFVEGVSG